MVGTRLTHRSDIKQMLFALVSEQQFVTAKYIYTVFLVTAIPNRYFG